MAKAAAEASQKSNHQDNNEPAENGLAFLWTAVVAIALAALAKWLPAESVPTEHYRLTPRAAT